MITLDTIRKPIADDLKIFEDMVERNFRADDSPMAEMLRYALSSRGKGVRPTLVLLSAAANSPSGHAGKRAALAAMLVEMIHVASLIHDDVIDESHMRRGRESLNARWQSKNAVVAGDYILARTISIGMSSGQYDLVQHISGTIATLCEGEVVQSMHVKKCDTSRQDYLEIIYKKTACLIAVSASAGAMAAGAPKEKIDAMHRYGEALGMAFQIKDDILDYTAACEATGKPSHNDLREGKITLPLIAVLEQSGEGRRRELLALLDRCREEDAAVEKLSRAVIEGGGTEAAARVMQSYLGRAAALMAGCEPSAARSSLVDLCAYVGQRDR